MGVVASTDSSACNRSAVALLSVEGSASSGSKFDGDLAASVVDKKVTSALFDAY